MSNNSIESNYFDGVNASPTIFEAIVHEKKPQPRLLHVRLASLFVRDIVDCKIPSPDPSSVELTPHRLTLQDSKPMALGEIIFDLFVVKKNGNTVAQTIAERTITLRNQFEFISIAQLILLLTLNLICLTFIMFACVWIS